MNEFFFFGSLSSHLGQFMKVLVSGSSGLVGSSLVPFLKGKGHEIVKLIRTPNPVSFHDVPWDLKRKLINPLDLEGFDAVIHLAGENLAEGRWNKEKKKKIKRSRLTSTRLLAKALLRLVHPPKVFICASAVGYYGNRGEEILTEKSSKGMGFLSDLCADWEGAAQVLLEKGIRVVPLRLGGILTPQGGMLEKMITPFKLGLGGIIGSGQQYMSWIAIEDVLNIVEEVLRKESYKGPINAVSPNPVTNYVFTKTLGKMLNRPTFMRLPKMMAQLIFGEMADEVLLASQRAIPEVLLNGSFPFQFPELELYLNQKK